jgi:hypothetical protein
MKSIKVYISIDNMFTILNKENWKTSCWYDICRPVQSRRLEAVPPKLLKWPIVGAPKLMSYVFGGACVEGDPISAIPCCSTSYKRHCLLFYVILLHFMGSNRAFEYVKDNDVRLGLRVSTRVANGGPQVTGLQCRFCIAFGREEKVGTKC